MSTNDKNATTVPVVPKTPGKPGRKKNIPLSQLDAENEEECRVEESSSSKRTSTRDSAPGKAKKAKKARKDAEPERRQDSSNDDSASSGTEFDSSESSSSDSSTKSDEPRKLAKKSGFISFKGVALITPDSKARLRKIETILKSVANLVPKIDQEGKEALKSFGREVSEYRDFVKELIRSTRSEIPDENPLKKRVVQQLKVLRDILIELYEDVDTNSEMPMMGSHLLDWSEVPALRQVLGTKTARRLRTSLKGQKKLYKPLFKKKPADIARNWMSQDERRKKNFNSSAAGYSRDSSRSGNSGRGGYSKNSGFGNNRGGKR